MAAVGQKSCLEPVLALWFKSTGAWSSRQPLGEDQVSVGLALNPNRLLVLGFLRGKPNIQVDKNEQGDLRVHGFDLEVAFFLIQGVWRSWDSESAAGLLFPKAPCAFLGCISGGWWGVRSFPWVLQEGLSMKHLLSAYFSLINHGAGTVSTVKALVHPRFAGHI